MSKDLREIDPVEALLQKEPYCRAINGCCGRFIPCGIGDTCGDCRISESTQLKILEVHNRLVNEEMPADQGNSEVISSNGDGQVESVIC